jgi:signal transduction histidine kinase
MRKTVFLFVFLISFTVLHAQQLSLETYTPTNGLVDARVSKMYQDSKGRLYFLTLEGFSVFDGQHFDNYGTESNYGTGIINEITEYKNGEVKLFSYDGDLYTLNNNHFIKDSSNRLLLREATKIFNLENDEKLIITNYHFLRQTGSQFRILPIASIRPGFIEYSVLQGNYLLIVQTSEEKKQKIYVYNYRSGQLVDSMKINSTVLFFNKMNNGVVMATADNKWLRFDSLLLQKGNLKTQPFNNDGLIPKDFVNPKIQQDNDGNYLWFIDAERGYCRVNIHTGTKEYFLVSDGILNTASWVFEDAEKNYWFGSTAKGVQKFQWSMLTKLSTISNTELGYVYTINKTENEEGFVSARGGIFLNKKKLGSPFKENNSLIFWQNECWQFTDYKTLVGSKGTIFHLEKLIPGYNAENFLFSHCSIDKEGGLIIAGRVFIFIDKYRHFRYFKPNYFCDNIVETSNKEYWCFLRSNEAIRLNWQNDSLVKTYSQLIPNLTPRFSLQWDDHTFIIATRIGGIKIFTWTNGKLTQTGSITKSNGLSNNFVTTLLRKDKEHLLAGTGGGLDQISFQGKDTLIENIAQLNNIFTPFTDLVQLHDTVILCRTIDGHLLKVTNSTRPPSVFAPSAFFKTISSNNREVDFTKEHVFDYANNNFSFKASAPSFFDNKKIGFNFLLTGPKQQWQQNTNSPDFEIKNLLPGSYSLLLTIQYPAKIYPDNQLSYQFTIQPPFWDRWWFRLATFLIGIAFIIFIVRWFYRRRLQKQIIEMEKQQAIEKERTRIATDMHDDFGANLSRIKFISEKVQVLHQGDQNLKNDLVKISLYSDEMAEKMNEIVWALNQRYDSLEDLISFSRAYAADFLQDKNIELKFTASILGNKKIQGELRRNIFMVIKEALHNIIKHAGAKTASIKFIEEQNRLKVLIEDDGKGIDMNNIRPFANGLENMKKRMESVGGQFQVFENKGTVISLEVPL